MTIQFRNYRHPDDYWLVDDFLIQNYRPGNADGNWLEPAWEYMHHHPALDGALLSKIGIWEDARQIVGVAHYESSLGEAFFQFSPGYAQLQAQMLDYAQQTLSGMNEEGQQYLRAYAHERDTSFLSLLQERGYQRNADNDRPLYQFVIPQPYPAIHLPDGFRLTSLAEDCDWGKVNRVIWRGFNHPGEPECGEQALEERQRMFDTPRARRDLKIAVRAPDGEFVAFCGMFYQAAHQYAYVEPVATDPAYRRLGLGKAAVLEGIRRCSLSGATVAYVGSDQAFYQAIGFVKVYNSQCWTRN